MPRIVVENGLRMALRAHWTNSEPVITIFDAEVRGGGSRTREEQIAATVADVAQNWQSQIVETQLPNNYTFEGIEWVDLDTLDSPTGFEPPNGSEGTVGASVQVQSPPSVTLMVTKTVEGRTRSRRHGRLYFPAVSEANVDEDGKVITAAKTSVQNSLNNFRNNVNDTLGIEGFTQLCVVSAPKDLPIRLLPITGFVVQDIVGSQRRRLAR